MLSSLAASELTRADEYLWSNPAGGSFHDPASWSPALVPGAGDRAMFSAEEIVKPFSVNLDADVTLFELIGFRGEVTLDLGGRALNLVEQLRINGTEGPTMLVRSGQLAAGSLLVGCDLPGGIVLEDLLATVGLLMVGCGNPVSSGEMTLSGPATRLDKIACCDTTIGMGAGNAGRLLLEDGATMDWRDGFFAVGREGGEGRLEIFGGALLSISDGSAGIGAGEQKDEPAEGSAVVAGAGSRWTNTGTLVIGISDGIGDLVVTDAGDVTASAIDVGIQGGTGRIHVRSGGRVAALDGGRIGDSNGDGGVVVEGAGSVLSYPFLGIGFGGVGELRITDGGLASGGRLEVGGSCGVALAEVRGPGSRLDFADELLVSGCDAGDPSALVVADDGSAAARSVFLRAFSATRLGAGGRIACENLFCDADARLEIQVVDDEGPSVESTGVAMIGGELVVTVPDGQPLDPGDSVAFLTASQIVGNFDSIVVPRQHVVEVTSTSVTLRRIDGAVSLALSPASPRLFTGYADQARALATYADGRTIDVSAAATWSTVDPAIATAEPGGFLCGIAPGSTVVEARFEGFVASAPLVVEAPGFDFGIEILTVTSEGVQSETAALDGAPSVSADGRFVAFTSDSDLLAGPTPGARDVLVKDRLTGSIEIASRDPNGNVMSMWGNDPQLSADGRFVVFGTAGFVDGAFNMDVWIRDRLAGSTECVSLASDGGPSNGSSDSPSVSDDGRFVAFRSRAGNLTAPPVDSGIYRLYVRDRLLGTTVLYDLFGTDGVAFPKVSGDGRMVALLPISTDYVPGSLLLVDLEDRSIEPIDVTNSGQPAAPAGVYSIAISTDGSRVAFLSDAANLIDSHNGVRHAYVRDRVAGSTTLVSVTEGGDPSPGPAGSLSMSPDGAFLAFRTAGGLVAADQNDGNDVYRVRFDGSGVELVSESETDGLAAGGSMWTGLSGDGSLVVFRSDSSTLAPFDRNRVSDLFARSMPVPAVGDLDGDGQVGALDLAILLAAWGTTGTADLDRDGQIGALDLAILLAAWGGP